MKVGGDIWGQEEQSCHLRILPLLSKHVIKTHIITDSHEIAENSRPLLNERA